MEFRLANLSQQTVFHRHPAFAHLFSKPCLNILLSLIFVVMVIVSSHRVVLRISAMPPRVCPFSWQLLPQVLLLPFLLFASLKIWVFFPFSACSPTSRDGFSGDKSQLSAMLRDAVPVMLFLACGSGVPKVMLEKRFLFGSLLLPLSRSQPGCSLFGDVGFFL